MSWPSHTVILSGAKNLRPNFEEEVQLLYPRRLGCDRKHQSMRQPMTTTEAPYVVRRPGRVLAGLGLTDYGALRPLFQQR